MEVPMSLKSLLAVFFSTFFTAPRSVNEQAVADYRAQIRLMSHSF